MYSLHPISICWQRLIAKIQLHIQIIYTFKSPFPWSTDVAGSSASYAFWRASSRLSWVPLGLNTRIVSRIAPKRTLLALTQFHLLQRSTLGLFDEEPGVRDKRAVENGKHQERLPSEVVDGMRGDLAEDKVEQPLRSSAGCDGSFADAGWEDLAHVEPFVKSEMYYVVAKQTHMVQGPKRCCRPWPRYKSYR